jgi:hypothetical protein
MAGSISSCYGAYRLGKPTSPWARRFYGERRPDMEANSERRFQIGRRTDRVKERCWDAIGGVTGDEYEARLSSIDRP